ncbi:MAG: DUF58 domain-containing protein [Oligoflexales bacterium]|nr:DUF58 domain-containing protein [Oligoflexales bacterium]
MILDAELIRQIKEVQIKAGYLANSALSGEYASAFRGIGMEFEEVREYVPGDDVRAIDWNVTAKMQKPFVKVFREERELTIMLLVDVSGSLHFTSRKRQKISIAAELAALLAYLAIRNNDKVGILLFSDKVEHYIPPKKGRAHVWNIIRQILSRDSAAGRTDINAALSFLLKVQKRKATCFLLSDFMADSYEKSIMLAARRYDLTCISIEDPNEQQVPKIGVVQLKDLESGEYVLVDTSSREFQKKHNEQIMLTKKYTKEMLRRYNVNQFTVNTNEPAVPVLVRYLRRRELAG